eukprot:GHVQ01018175.1.p1 GENE.GHVQ01018175.1~~GHVQ01018175.1.p1  ORF type:complete len:123 (-),score=22.97 GHVQ01018175.1:693-1028(-)
MEIVRHLLQQRGAKREMIDYIENQDCEQEDTEEEDVADVEVSVVTTGVAEALGTASSEYKQSESREISSTCCCICFDRAKDTLLAPCGHVATCFVCATNLMESKYDCPICR